MLTNNKAQEEALAACHNQPFFAFFMEPGMGKTRTALKDAERLHVEQSVRRVLILAPGGVIGNWVKLEIPKHFEPETLANSHVHFWRGGHTKTEQAELSKLCQKSNAIQILCMNIEALSSAKYAEKWATEFVRGARCLLVIDEATSIGSHTSSRSQAVHRLRHGCAFKRILTGTPFCGGPDKIYSQMLGLGPTVIGHRNIFSFRQRYAKLVNLEIRDKSAKPVEGREAKNRTITTVAGFLRQDELKEKLSSHCFFAAKKDYLDLPAKVLVTRSVELTKEQARVITDIKEQWLAELGPESFVQVKNALGVRLRILQAYAGHTINSLDGSVVPIPSNRLRALQEQLEEYGPGCVIWAQFKYSHEEMKKALGPRAVFYNGNTPLEQRPSLVAAFQDGYADTFVGSMAGGFGITLTRAMSEVYYTPVPGVEARVQSGDRTHRIGQVNSVVSCDLIVEGGLDEKIRRDQLDGVDFSGQMMSKKEALDYLF